jgi:hypothetical protein
MISDTHGYIMGASCKGDTDVSLGVTIIDGIFEEVVEPVMLKEQEQEALELHLLLK